MTEKSEHPEHPGCFLSILTLPFLPKHWISAANASNGAVVLPFIALCLLLSGAASFGFVYRYDKQIRDFASVYDSKFDPVEILSNRVKVKGERLPRFESGGVTFLVDPDKTVDVETLGEKWIVLGRFELQHDIKVLPPDTFPNGHLRNVIAKFVGWDEPYALVDGEAIIRGLDTYGRDFATFAVVVLFSFFFLADVLGGLLYAAFVGFTMKSLKGDALGLDAEHCFRVALATAAPTLVLNFGHRLFYLSEGVPAGVVVWCGMMFGLCYWIFPKIVVAKPAADDAERDVAGAADEAGPHDG